MRLKASLTSIALTLAVQFLASTVYSENICSKIFSSIPDNNNLLNLPSQKRLKNIFSADFKNTPLSRQEERASMIKFAAIREKFLSLLSLAQMEALEDYMSNGFEVINSFLRGLPEPPPGNGVVRRGGIRPHETVAIIDGVFANSVELPKGLWLFRGVKENTPDPIVEDGVVTLDKAYISTTTYFDMAESHSYNHGVSSYPKIYAIEISGPGTKGIFGTFHEEEIILPRNSKFFYNSSQLVATETKPVQVIWLSTHKKTHQPGS